MVFISSKNLMNFRSLYCYRKNILEAWKVKEVISRRSVSVISSLQNLKRDQILQTSKLYSFTGLKS